MEFNKKYVQLNTEKYAYLEKGSGEHVILIHGNMSSSVHYMPLFDRLDGYHLIAPDLRGFGDSSYVERFDSITQLSQDVYQFMNALHIDSAHFICWSAGCTVTLALASMYPDKVKSIFAIEGGSHKGYPVFTKDKSLQSQYGKVYKSKEEMATDPVQVAPVQMMMESHNAIGMTAIWDAVIYTCAKPDMEDNQVYMSETLKQRCLVDLDWALANFNMSPTYNAYTKGDNSIASVTCPCAFTTADKDNTVPGWMVMENFNAIEGAKLIAYINCGHSPLVDCPDKLAQDIKQFLTSK